MNYADKRKFDKLNNGIANATLMVEEAKDKGLEKDILRCNRILESQSNALKNFLKKHPEYE